VLAFALVPVFSSSMRPHFISLLGQSWEVMVRATGTTTLGFIVWTLALTAVGWASAVAGRWFELKREKAVEPLRKALYGSFWPGVVLGAGVFGVMIFAFTVSMIFTVFQDHQSLKRTNKELNQHVMDLKAQDVGIAMNTEYANVTNTVQAFRLLMPQQTKICWVRITAPRENRQLVQILAHISATFCRVDSPFDPAQPDDEILRGSLKDSILVHMKKTVPDRNSFIVALGNVFSVRRTYELPSGFPDELVWIQIGQGNPWRKDMTKSGTEQ